MQVIIIIKTGNQGQHPTRLNHPFSEPTNNKREPNPSLRVSCTNYKCLALKANLQLLVAGRNTKALLDSTVTLGLIEGAEEEVRDLLGLERARSLAPEFLEVGNAGDSGASTGSIGGDEVVTESRPASFTDDEGLAADRCLSVGDRLEKDILGSLDGSALPVRETVHEDDLGGGC